MLFRGGRRDVEDWLVEAGVEGEGVCELLAAELPFVEGPPMEHAPGVGRFSIAGVGVSNLTSVAILTRFLEAASAGDFQNRSNASRSRRFRSQAPFRADLWVGKEGVATTVGAAWGRALVEL